MAKIYTAFFIIMVSVSAYAQNEKRICGAMDHHHHLETTQPGYLLKRNQIEQFTQNFITNPSKKNRAVITIPVVFHVVYKTAIQNIPDSQIHSQIATLNQDFRRLNTDFVNTPGPFQGISADCEIQFVLARRDPNGDSTTGITRTLTTVTTFSVNDNVKRSIDGGKDPWPTTDYLNIWVCKLSNGLLGYAQFPGGPILSDGVVLSYRGTGSNGTALAPYNKGRTATHEIGHWLNLFHIWGDDGGSCNGTDLVGDTPNQASENYGCPVYPKISCANNPSGEMFMNFMDYTDDACMSMFSAGQKSRMDAMFVIGGPRHSLLSSLGGQYPTPVINCGTPNNLQSTTLGYNTATIVWDAVIGATSYTVQIKETGGVNWLTYTSSAPSYTFQNLNSLTNYEIQIQATCPSGPSIFSSIFSLTTSSAPPLTCGTPSSLFSTNISSNSTDLSWQSVLDAVQYSIFYRELGMPNWDSIACLSPTIVLDNLIPQTAYEYFIRSTCPYGISPNSTLEYFTTLSSTVPACTEDNEPNDVVLNAIPLTKNTISTSIISSEMDQDYFTFTTTQQQPKFKVSLTNVPADYDLRIYNSNGILTLSSQNGRIQPEVCISNNSSLAETYYVKVNGYNGKFDSVNCYRLLLETSNSDFKIQDVNEFDSEKKSSLLYYPNPANNYVKLELYANGNQDTYYELVNLLGQISISGIFTTHTGLNNFDLNTTAIPNGVYLLKIQNKNEKIIEKVNIVH